jgi:membrane protein YdbS with pleckstrin-like domain
VSPQYLNGETPITGVRQSWAVLVPTVATAVVAIIAVAVGAHFVPATVLGHKSSTVVGAAIAVVVIVALGSVAVQTLQWRASTYTLTNHRIIRSRGVISRVTESIALDRIQDTTVRRNLGQRTIGCGDIEIESAGRDGVELLHLIPNPDAFYSALMEAMEAYRHPAPPPGAYPPGAYPPGAYPPGSYPPTPYPTAPYPTDDV